MQGRQGTFALNILPIPPHPVRRAAAATEPLAELLGRLATADACPLHRQIDHDPQIRLVVAADHGQLVGPRQHVGVVALDAALIIDCLLYTSPSPRD